jgi:hypothetical protein
MRMIAASTSSGTSGRSSRKGGGGSSVCARMSAKLEPENGGRPANISYATIASEYWSLAPVSSFA